MNYGWLTQSSILPKKSKEIVVSDSGTVALQAAMMQLKNKQKEGIKNIPKTKPIKKNTGVEERNKKDQAMSNEKVITQKNYHKCLERKAQVYHRLGDKKKNVAGLLVDFEAKEFLNASQAEEEQYQLDRQAFYSGKIQAVDEQQQVIHDNVETQKSSLTQMRERLAWEKQMLNELKGEQEGEVKPKVVQSFDHILTKQEKEALGHVVDEGRQQKLKLQQIRRRRQMLEEEKIRKLRKLNIIKENKDQPKDDNIK